MNAPNAPSQSGDPGSAEIARIRAEYVRRGNELQRTYGLNLPVNQFWQTQTARAAIAALTRHKAWPLQGPVADIGCGRGNWLLEFVKWGIEPPEIAGIDLSPDHLATARRRFPHADLHSGDARFLPWPNDHFQLVSQFVMFTSILDDAVRLAVASEMWRILKPGGFILWYDFRYNNPRNKNVRAVTKKELHQLFPKGRFDVRTVTLVPPLARAIVPVTWMGALLLEKIPLLRGHFLALIEKPIHW